MLQLHVYTYAPHTTYASFNFLIYSVDRSIRGIGEFSPFLGHFGAEKKKKMTQGWVVNGESPR
jgi:hypothetical protein